MCVEHTFIETSHSHICTSCGLEKSYTHIDSWNPCSAPINKGYERTVRFRQKVDKLLFLQNAPRVEAPVWKFLEGCTLKTPNDVRKALRQFSGKNKHYDSIRLFTRCFTPFRVVPKHDALRLNGCLTLLFRFVLRLWNRYNIRTKRLPFYSYDFLLRAFLVKLESPLVAFCKPITCKKRHARNNERLAVILAAGSGESCYRSFAVTHSRCGLQSEESRLCPQTSASSPPAVDEEEGEAVRDSPVQDA